MYRQIESNHGASQYPRAKTPEIGFGLAIALLTKDTAAIIVGFLFFLLPTNSSSSILSVARLTSV
jgi:hypothetical protein